MTEYDKIAEAYIRMETSRLERIYIIDPSFMDKVGDVRGKTILDLACGSGNFSKRFKKKGAKEVIGVDISEEMIRSAKNRASQEGLDIEYIIDDVACLRKLKKFDLVTAAFLLHYSKTKRGSFANV